MRRLLTSTIVCLAVVAGCGSDPGPTAESSSADVATTSPNPDNLDKPDVQIPDELPTELVITELTEGSGRAAAVGDTVEVHYVGVRSVNGEEFDNSYDRGQTFPVTLGSGDVIAGWDEGLIGIKAGGRRQLDIPADLAYGDSPRPGVIQPGDALTFVIDALSVTEGIDVPTADPADKPDVDVATSVGATEVGITDLVVGDGDEATSGKAVYVHITTYRGDTAEELGSTWETGDPAMLRLDDSTLPGFVKGVTGMRVGGRRAIVIPPAEGFGPDGEANIGLPPATDLIVVVDLVLVTD